MTSRARSLLAQIGSFALAGVLLYLALRGVELGAVVRALTDADYTWLLPLIVVVLGSHLLRAWRWQVLIEALPEVAPKESLQAGASEGGQARVPTLKTSFYSVMIGYMVNYAAPRLGEIARTANLAAQTKLSFSSVFGTVVVERILDVIVLAASIASVFVLLIDRSATLNRLFIAPIAEQLGRIPALAVGAAIVLLTLAVAYIFRQVLRNQESASYRFWDQRAKPALTAFKDGLATLLRVRRWGVLVGTTITIWFLYLLAAYLPFIILGSAEAFDISLLDTWSIMVLGAIGVTIPSPGGTGSYHYITVQTLVFLFGVTHEAAATYAVLTHAAQLVLYVLTGAVCLVLQGSSLKALKRRTEAAQEEQSV